MWLTALVNALPALANVAKDVINGDQKTAQAAQVAADPHAPPDVKQAAANVAKQALDDKHKAEQSALQAATGQPANSSGNGLAIAAAVVIGVLMLGKRRR